MRNFDASLIILWRDSVPTTHCKQRRWSTRPICGWPTKLIHTDRTARTSSPSPPERCVKSWLATSGVSDPKSAAGARLWWNWTKERLSHRRNQRKLLNYTRHWKDWRHSTQEKLKLSS